MQDLCSEIDSEQACGKATKASKDEWGSLNSFFIFLFKSKSLLISPIITFVKIPSEFRVFFIKSIVFRCVDQIRTFLLFFLIL